MANLRFYDFAEDDYYYLKSSIEAGLKRNAMCSMSQSICERYLKQIIVNYIDETEKNKDEFTTILRAHNIKKIINFINKNLNDFTLDKKVRDCNGYYYDTRYPGDDSFFVSDEDVQICWEAVKVCKIDVDSYINSHPNKISEFRNR